jgi:hypothetical protein
MALNNPIDFYSYLENTSKYIEISLNSINDVNLCKNGIISFSELIRAYNEKYISYINKIFPLIYEIISNKNSDKILKANVFLVFTDVFNINNEEIYKFYKPTMDAIINAMSASLKQSLNNEEEDEIIEYFILLRERIFESLNLIYTYLGNFNKNQEFEIYVDNILKYINIICERKYSMTKDTAKFIIGIFGDVSDVFIENVKNNFNKNNIDYLINIILENNNNNNNNDMNEEIISLKKKNENLEILVNNLNKEIEEKNNQMNSITKNHQEDLNELNASIMVLKTKISQLQEENESLSNSQREILEKYKN